MNALRMYVRSVLAEAVGQITYQRTDIGRAADKFSAGEVLSQGTNFLKDVVKGMATLKAAGSVMSRSKTGKVAAGWNATKGSRKSLVKAAAAIGVVGYALSQSYASTRNANTSPEPTARDEELQALLAKFHDEVIGALDSKQASLIASYMTPEMKSVDASSVSEDEAKALFKNFSANYTKYVTSYTTVGSIPIGNRYDMLQQTSAGQEVKATITAIAQRYATTDSKGDLSEDGLKYYAACLMQIYEAQLLVGAMQTDMDKIPNTLQAKADFDRFAAAKKSSIDKTKALAEAIAVGSGME
jgi:hypothetical protein